MRRILLPAVLAVAACGVLTSSSLAQAPAVQVAQVTVTAEADHAAGGEALAAPGLGLLPAPKAEVVQAPPKTTPAKPPQEKPKAPPAQPQQNAVPAPKVEQAPAEAAQLPNTGLTTQIITVYAASPTDTTATLKAWARDGNTWHVVYGPMTAFVGSQGIGQASETTSKTPAGTWGLTESFGIQADNGTRLPFFQVDAQDWWVSDANSPMYNTHQRCAVGTCPFNEGAGERLQAAGTAYNHAVVIDYNRSPVVPGAGSAFFLHVSTGRPTAGCVSIPADQLDNIMRWLDPAQHPEIQIKAGS